MAAEKIMMADGGVGYYDSGKMYTEEGYKKRMQGGGVESGIPYKDPSMLSPKEDYYGAYAREGMGFSLNEAADSSFLTPETQQRYALAKALDRRLYNKPKNLRYTPQGDSIDFRIPRNLSAVTDRYAWNTRLMPAYSGPIESLRASTPEIKSDATPSSNRPSYEEIMREEANMAAPATSTAKPMSPAEAGKARMPIMFGGEQRYLVGNAPEGQPAQKVKGEPTPTEAPAKVVATRAYRGEESPVINASSMDEAFRKIQSEGIKLSGNNVFWYKGRPIKYEFAKEAKSDKPEKGEKLGVYTKGSKGEEQGLATDTPTKVLPEIEISGEAPKKKEKPAEVEKKPSMVDMLRNRIFSPLGKM